MTQFGPPTANEHLRTSMVSSIEWQSRHAPLDCMPEGLGEDIISPAKLTVRVNRWVVGCIVLGGAMWALGWLYVANAAEQPRPWIVWDLGADKPWTSPKGYQATATGPTACNLSLHEASKASPDGSRLSCKRIDQRKGQ